MWLQFVISLGLFLLILVIPGFCFFRLLKTSRLEALLLSPVFSVSLYSVLGILYGLLGVSSSVVSVFAIPLALLLAGSAVKLAKEKGRLAASGKPRESVIPGCSCADARMAAFYLACGIIAGTMLFLKPLDGADSFISTYDNLYHYNAIRALVESGYWSPLDTSCYLALPSALNPMPGGTYPLDGYYPLGWHILLALLMELSGCALPVAVNVANFAFTSVIFPSGMYLLMIALFRKKSTLTAGALCSCVCAAFPWYMLLEWPLFPNLAAFCLIPVLAACFIRLAKRLATRVVSGEAPGKGSETPVLLAGFLSACIACAAIHPNSIFTAALLLAPFVVWVFAWAIGGKYGVVAGIVSGIAVGAIIVIAWVLLANADSFKYVMDEATKARQLPEEAWMAVTEFSFMNKAGQPILFVFSLVGVAAILASRGNCWIVVSFALVVLVYVASASFEEGPLRQILTGFWYSEPKRIGSIAGLASMPLVACGLSALYELVTALVARILGARVGARRADVRCANSRRLDLRRESAGQVAGIGPSDACANNRGRDNESDCPPANGEGVRRMRAALAAVFALAFVGVVFFAPYVPPANQEHLDQSQDVQESDATAVNASALQGMALYAKMNYENPILDREEVVFIQKVAATIGLDQAVINLPYDGSLIAYGLTGLKAYYLERYGYESTHETPESALIRTKLSEISTRVDVLEAVQGTGCRYVLLLKRDKDIVYNFDESLWQGISSIDDTTPGFTPVLSEGDMRLYRIDAA